MTIDATDPAEAYRATVRQAIAIAGENLEAALDESVLRALAALADDPKQLASYAMLSAELVKSNKSLRRSDLDAAVATFRKKAGGGGEADQAPDEIRDGVLPWDEEVDGLALAGEISERIQRHCVLPTGAADAITLWILGAYAIDAFRVFPKLLLHSPQKRCGKTTLLEVLAALMPKPLTGSNVTPSVIFRAIETWRVSVLLDEVDTFIHGNDELRGIVNSGHTRSTAWVWRVEGETVREPVRYSTWSPMVIAMIGSPPSTVLDRSLTIALERKAQGDVVDRLPRTLLEDLEPVRRRCQRWADDRFEELAVLEPRVPEVGNDRAVDNWSAPVAVATLIGADWQRRAGDAMRSITAGAVGDSDDLSIELLSDLREILDEEPARQVWPSASLTGRLNALEERPWPTVMRGKELSQNKLARLLRPYRLTSGSVRTGPSGPNGTAKGYKRAGLVQAFERYLPSSRSGVPPAASGTPAQANGAAAPSDFESGTTGDVVPDANRLGANGHAGCAGVPDTTGGSREPEKVSGAEGFL